MKIALIFPPWSHDSQQFKKVAKKTSSVPPLNLCIVAALAEKAGWEVKIIDGEVDSLSDDEMIAQVSSFQPDLIGMTATSVAYGAILGFARNLKKRLPTPIILGGVHASLFMKDAFDDAFDYLFLGEAEITFPEFLNRFADRSEDMGVRGIVWRKNGEVIGGQQAPALENLDLGPYPARSLLPDGKYILGTLKGKKRFTTLMMSRGCPYSCVFCSHGLFGKSVRRRSIENVIEEIDLVVNKFKMEHILFLDDTFTLKRDYIIELCDAIEKRNLKFTFECGTRADLWDEPLVHRLKKCGLIRVSFGLESADENVRKIMKKNVDMNSYLVSNALNNRLGVETINSVMLGLPGETRESIKKTVDFLCSNRDIQHATYGIAMPYPGTEMLEMAKLNMHGLKLVETDFSKYQRYSSAVMEVNGIKPDELVQLQIEGLARIYSCWWRIIPMLRRHGLMAILPLALGAIKMRFVKVVKKAFPFFKAEPLRE